VNLSKQVGTEWDLRFLGLASVVASWSKDPSTQCGAVIIRPDKTVASVGFNGFPKGCDDDPALYADRDLKYSRVVHAECNAILHAREPLQGYTIYTWPPGYGPSCDRCAAHIIQAGITRVVHKQTPSDFASRWKEAAERGLQMYEEAGVEVVHL
jgi:dCMP deaminase